MVELTPKRIASFIEPFRVQPGRRVRLPRDFDPSGTREQSKAEAKDVLAVGVGLLAEYQMRLAAQDTYGVLVVLQAMDAAGKDGTIRHVMSGVNPQGVQVSSFKVPSSEDLDHDYLWRYAKRLPESAATSGSSTAPITRRSSSSGSTPRSWPGRSCHRRPRAGTSGTGGSARSTTGSATSPTRASGS